MQQVSCLGFYATLTHHPFVARHPSSKWNGVFGYCSHVFGLNSVANSWDTQYYIKNYRFYIIFSFSFHIKSSVYRDDIVDVAAPNPRQLTCCI